MKHFRPDTSVTPLPSRLPHVDPASCRALWVTVLLTALRDLCDPKPRSPARDAAERWVGARPDRNFRAVCTMAGMDVRRVHRRMVALMALPASERRAGVPRLHNPTFAPRPVASSKARNETAAGPANPAQVALHPDLRCDRVAEMFARGVVPSDMTAAFAAEGHAVSLSQVWNDIRHLRKAGRIGYLRDPRAPVHGQQRLHRTSNRRKVAP